MSLVVFEQVSLNYGSRCIVDSLDWRIGHGEKIGLIGANGSGKTSLLRVLAGEQSMDKGQVRRVKGLRLGYLPQDIRLQGGRGLLDFVLSSVPGREQLDLDLKRCEEEMEQLQQRQEEGDPHYEENWMSLASRMAETHERLDHFETQYTEHEALRILSGLGFTSRDSSRDLEEFSGGWKMRALLSALLFQLPDLLLLDEPTNHLDMPSVAWFSDFLLNYKPAMILICHDREFLNEQINRVVSFEVEGVRQYKGNYEQYLRQREEELTVLVNKARNIAKEREKAEQFITRFRAQANKAKAVQSRVKALERMETIDEIEFKKTMRFQFPPTDRCSQEVVRVQGLKKSFGDHTILSDLDLRVLRGQKIAIIGVNGAGKTTLLRMIANELDFDEGKIQLGGGVKAGYYAQHHADTLDPKLDLLEIVGAEDPNANPTRIRAILGAFLFGEDDVDKKIGVLSGGERARVALARLLMRPGNLLIMDEPTNHLDLQSSESLGESLAQYDGTLMFVSHNRSFVRKLATQIWNVADGKVEVYPGTLDEYLYSCRQREDAEAELDKARATSSEKSESKAKVILASEQTKGQSPTSSKNSVKPAKTRAETRKQKQESAEKRKQRKQILGPLESKVSTCEADISRVEAEQRQHSMALADPKVYEQSKRRDELLIAYRRTSDELERLNQEWESAQIALEKARSTLDCQE